MNLARRLPTATNPCGQITFQTADDSNEGQGIGRFDYQLTPDLSVFGRYMATFIRKPPAYEGGSDNVLKAINSGLDNLAHALTAGDTWVLGPTMVNSMRVAYNRTTVNRYNTPYFDQPGPAMGAVPRHERGQQRRVQLQARQVPARRQEQRVRERARGHAVSRRRWISGRTDGAEQAVDELLAEGWRGVGRDR
jgi:hypothetical protein